MTMTSYLPTSTSPLPLHYQITIPSHRFCSPSPDLPQSPKNPNSIIEKASLIARDPISYQKTTSDELSSSLLTSSYFYTPSINDSKINAPPSLKRRLIGHLIVPSSFLHSTRKVVDLRQKFVETHLNDPTGWKVKRLTIQIGEKTFIDTLIVFKPESLQKQRWLLRVGGSTEIYEKRLQEPHWSSWSSFADAVHLSGLVYFNPPYIGESKSDFPLCKKLLLLSVKAVLHFMKDSHGIGAKHIVVYGLSMGGGIVNSFFQDMLDHSLHPTDRITAVISDKSYATFSPAVQERFKLEFLSRLITDHDWDLGSIDAFTKLSTQKLVISAADDAIIPSKNSLAKHVKDDEKTSLIQHVGGHTSSFLDDLKARLGVIEFLLNAFKISSDRQHRPYNSTSSPTRFTPHSPKSTPHSPSRSPAQRALFPSNALRILIPSIETNEAQILAINSTPFRSLSSMNSHNSSSSFLDCRTP